MSRYLGVDLAWGARTGLKLANETGLVLLDDCGTILEAGWAAGTTAVMAWIVDVLERGDVIAIDAPLVVTNSVGQRLCETETSSRYMHPWKVGANSSNLAKRDLSGVTLRKDLESSGVRYIDGLAAHDGTTVMFECYPYTTIVGSLELGYDERPRYKRPAKELPSAQRKAFRAAECDELIRRVAGLANAKTPMDLRTHPATHNLMLTPSPEDNHGYKHREDLLDAALAAWTAALWAREPDRVQVLGATAELDADGRRPTIVAPAKPEQRRF